MKKPPLRNEVMGRLHDKNRILFSLGDRDGLAAKFINPKHKLGKGYHDGNPREFTAIAKNIIKIECSWRDPLYISESLALIIVAARKWLDWHKNAPADSKSVLNALLDELRSYGFTKPKELSAIHAFITWDGGKIRSLRRLTSPIKPRHPPKSA